MNADCHEVSPECPVSATLYGDYFTMAATVTYAVIFGIMLVVQAFFTWKSKLWSYGAWLLAGTAFEFIGYICRSLMAENPYNNSAFLGQITVLVLGPTLVAAAISVTFKHLVLWHGPEYSFIRPSLYPTVFVGTDVVSILVQGAGGGLAASATSQSMVDMGNYLLLGGVCFQVVNMTFCGGLILGYVWRRRRAMTEGPMQMASEWHDGRANVPLCYQGPLSEVKRTRSKVMVFIISLSVAYIAILARCSYRIVEMAAGWGSELMQNEATFMVLDGALLMLACGLLTIFHPAVWFPFMCKRDKSSAKEDGEWEMSSAEGLTQPQTVTGLEK